MVGAAAILVGFFGAVAQLVRVRNEGIEGVSLRTWLLFSLFGGYWISYGAFSAHSAIVILGSLVVWPVQFYIVGRLRPWRHPQALLQSVGFFALTCLAPGAVGGWSATLVGCGVGMGLLRLPQIIELVRFREASGVSVASWLLGALNALLWITYYVLVHRWGALAATAIALATNVIVASLAMWRHHQTSSPISIALSGALSSA